MPTRTRPQASHGVTYRRRHSMEALEPRLALAVDLVSAGVFQALDVSDIVNTAYEGRSGGLVADGAGNRYVAINGRNTHSVDLDPGPAVNAVTLDAAIVKLNPDGTVAWKAAFDSADNGSLYPGIVRLFPAVDANQNVYLTGEFRGTFDIDPGPGVANITSVNGGKDFSFYMAKLNSTGQLLWYQTLLVDHLEPRQVAVDAQGNFIIANELTGVIAPFDADPGPGQAMIQQNAGELLVLKYDTNGNFGWARQMGSAGTIPALGVNDAGDVFISDSYQGTLDIDPGAGAYYVTNTDTAGDRYLTRLDPAGNFVWGYTTEGPGSVGFRDFAFEDDGSIVIGGSFTGTTDFQPGAGNLSLTSTGSYGNGLALKLNADASVAWVRQFGGLYERVYETEVDDAGNVYLGGSFNLNNAVQTGVIADFDPGPGVYALTPPASYETAFVLSLTPNGDFRWAAPLGGNAARTALQGMSVTPDGNVHVSGASKGNADFDPDPGAEYWVNSGALQSVYVATLTHSEPDPGAPVVDAGPNQTILVSSAANLDGAVTDDGLPNPVTTTWSLHSGPGAVTFGNAAALDTTASFSALGSYTLKLTADDGQFTTTDYVTITVDPVTAALTATADAYIDTGKATTNFGDSTSLTADGKPDLSALLKWDLSSIPAGSTLQSVTLSINVTGTSADTYEIYELKRSWTESQVTWKKANSTTNWQSAGADGAQDRGSTVLGTVTATATGVHNVVLNAAGLAVVQGWVNDPATNFGFIIQDYANATDDDLAFSSREASDAANRPQLHVAYNPLTAPPAVVLETISFTSPNAPLAIPDQATATSTLIVPDAFSILDVDVTLNISHAKVKDLDVYLIGPDGARVQLFANVGVNKDANFTGTILDDEAATPIKNGAAPFTGRCQPQGSLGVFDGKNAAGAWTLEVTDDTKKNTGTLDGWSLEFTRQATSNVPPPRIDLFSASHERVSIGTPIALSATRDHSPLQAFQTVSFYRDNGDGVLVADEDDLVGTDASPATGADHMSWTATVDTTGLAPGSYTFFALASNAGGDAQAALDVEVFGLEVVSVASPNAPLAIPDKATIASTLIVPDSFSILDVDVTLNISHAKVKDLDVYLIGPDGARVQLFANVGANKDANFTGTILDDEAATPIASGAAPFTGAFRPQSSLTTFDGKNAMGVWTLEITDDTKKNTGTLVGWSLQFTREAAPPAVYGGMSLLAEGVKAPTSPTAVAKSQAVENGQLAAIARSDQEMVSAAPQAQESPVTSPRRASLLMTRNEDNGEAEHAVAALDAALSTFAENPLSTLWR